MVNETNSTLNGRRRPKGMAIRPSRNAAKSSTTPARTKVANSTSGSAAATTATTLTDGTDAGNEERNRIVSFAITNNSNNDDDDLAEDTAQMMMNNVPHQTTISLKDNVGSNNEKEDSTTPVTTAEIRQQPQQSSSILKKKRVLPRPINTTGNKRLRPTTKISGNQSTGNSLQKQPSTTIAGTKSTVIVASTVGLADDDDEDDDIASATTTNAVAVGGGGASTVVNSSSSGAGGGNNQQPTNTIVQQHQQHQVAAAATVIVCPNCGSNAIEQHEASGATICTECGVVVEENAIVSSIEFVEGAGGSSNMVGQYVSATSSKAYTSSGSGGNHNIRGGGRYGFSRDSRETTLANGRRRIQELASRLRLSSHYVDGAHRLFTVAVERNFVQGRRTAHVVAACLYIACRQEKSQHMLIDFSDALQVNVYTLGTCFLKFRRLLGLKLEIIDPALYVYRFAAHLDLDDRANAVSLTSLRLIARMKRDWIVSGRRPAGICAAALLISARAHGFDKHCADVTRILRVCGMTVANRVREFERTPTAHLSLDQFQTIDFEAEADPPIYTKNKIREARAKAIQEGNVPLLTSGVLDDDGKRGSRWRNSITAATAIATAADATARQKQPKQVQSERSMKLQELYETLDKKLNNDDGMDEAQAQMHNVDKAIPESQQLVVHGGGVDAVTEGGDALSGSVLIKWKDAYPKHRGRDIVMPHEATVEEQLPSIVPTEAKLSLSDWKQSLPNSIDLEIEDFFRTSKEEKEKELIFNKINKDYIAQQERKENERLDLEAATKDQDVDDMAQAAGQARYKDVVGRNAATSTTTGMSSKSKRHRDSSSGDMNGNNPNTTEEQLRAAVASRRVSRKINYDALSSIFDDDGSFATTTFAAVGPDEDGNNDDDDENDVYDSNYVQEEVVL